MKRDDNEGGDETQLLKSAKEFKEAETLENQNLLESTNDASGHDRPSFLALQHVGSSTPRDRLRSTNRHNPDWLFTGELQCRALGFNACYQNVLLINLHCSCSKPGTEPIVNTFLSRLDSAHKSHHSTYVMAHHTNSPKTTSSPWRLLVSARLVIRFHSAT
jgi:hypothetical protein